MSKRPRIAINTRFLLKGKMEGFGWYTYEISKRLVEQNPDVDFYFFFDRPFDPKFIFSKNVTPVVISPPARHPLLFIVWFEIRVKRALKKHKIDLFFSPDGYLSLSSKIPQIGTIHDINFEHYPEDLPYSARKYLGYFFPKFAKKASEIITVSNFSKRDIAETYHINESKITAIWNGASDSFKPLDPKQKQTIRKEYSEQKPYFIYVGSIHPRKNVERLIKAYQVYRVKSSDPWNLIIVGESMWKDKVYNQNNNEGIIFTGRMELNTLSQLVGAAGALSYVPYFEGFGIPLVEAMKSGIPILSGNQTSLPEVAEEAAIYCDPFDINSIMEGMLQIANNPALQSTLSMQGLKRGGLFSWDIAAEKTWEVLSRNLPK
jgi:glycosyltransferase involved in cell wall biosynthesis